MAPELTTRKKKMEGRGREWKPDDMAPELTTRKTDAEIAMKSLRNALARHLSATAASGRYAVDMLGLEADLDRIHWRPYWRGGRSRRREQWSEFALSESIRCSCYAVVTAVVVVDAVSNIGSGRR